MPRNHGGREKGTAAGPRVRALALGPYGRAGADVLRTKYGTRRGREGEREKEADNKQGRRTDDGGGGGGGLSERARLHTDDEVHICKRRISLSAIRRCVRSFVVRMLELQMLQYDHKRMLHREIDPNLRQSVPYGDSDTITKASISGDRS